MTGPFGVRVREWRVGSGLTREELADALGVTTDTVLDYESGARRHLARHVLLGLERVTGVPADDWQAAHDTSERYIGDGACEVHDFERSTCGASCRNCSVHLREVG